MAQTTETARRGGDRPAGEEASPAWHTLSVDDVVQRLGADVVRGLEDEDAAARLRDTGPNALPEGRRTPAWRRILALLADRLTLVLVVAAIVSAVVSREWETPVVILLVITFNTALNYWQESKAESSLEALQESAVTTAVVRRGGAEKEVPSADLVPGDVVVLDAGDSVPADGRLVEAVRLQVAEAPLTGESSPVEKGTEPLEDPGLPTAERSDMAFMSTDVSRGRAVMVVTATGAETEIGGVARSLGTAGVEKTPLQRRTDQLAGTLTVVALVVVAVVFVIGLVRGRSVSELLITAVSLAVATIPEGLTAVVAFTLAIGATRLARRGAIVKNLAAVETLGSTTDIATDKTGTLTLNQMTVRRLLMAGRSYTVSGEGYSTEGEVRTGGGDPPPPSLDAFLAMALCNDGTVADGEVTGDPTDAALVVLAEKGGVDVDAVRRSHPRVTEVPFDSDHKFQATVHEQAALVDQGSTGDATPARYRCFVKGAPVVVLERADSIQDDDGIRPMSDQERERIREQVDELAAEGLRTLAVAGRRYDEELPEDADELREAVRGLTLYAVVGILDPPREQARDAIATAHAAGIEVHMITGDDQTTASAIARELDLRGDAASGSDLDGIDDDDLTRRAGEYGVLARVSPQHKIRVVQALQRAGGVVAMTGDGVNDAPALKQADIGVAMGITGTDVSKGAADMVLTDDDFATIVSAVEGGRGIYANILKFVRFQLTTAWGFVLVFLVCSVAGIAGGAPFTALQILLVNIIIDGPPALALGVDPVERGVMQQPPRPPSERLLTRDRLVRILVLGVVMTAGTVLVLVAAPTWFPGSAEDPLFATTLAFATFVFYQVFNLLNVRSDTGSVFSWTQLSSNRAILASLVGVVLLVVAVVHVGLLQRLFDTTALSGGQWLTAVAVASSVLWVEELRKVVARRRR